MNIELKHLLIGAIIVVLLFPQLPSQLIGELSPAPASIKGEAARKAPTAPRRLSPPPAREAPAPAALPDCASVKDTVTACERVEEVPVVSNDAVSPCDLPINWGKPECPGTGTVTEDNVEDNPLVAAPELVSNEDQHPYVAAPDQPNDCDATPKPLVCL